MDRERRSVFARFKHRLIKQFSFFGGRGSRQCNNARSSREDNLKNGKCTSNKGNKFDKDDVCQVKLGHSENDNDNTNVIILLSEDNTYIISSALCVSGMSFDEQDNRKENKRKYTEDCKFSVIEQKQIIECFYIHASEIGRSDSELEGINMYQKRLPESGTPPAVMGCRKKSIVSLCLDELQDDSDSEESDPKSTSLDTGYYSERSFNVLNTKEYQSEDTQKCQSENLSNSTPKSIETDCNETSKSLSVCSLSDSMETETDCYETSGSLSELSLSGSTVTNDPLILNSGHSGDHSLNPFYDVHSMSDINEQSEKLRIRSQYDIPEGIVSDYLEVYTDPHFDEVQHFVEKFKNKSFNKELTRESSREICLPYQADLKCQRLSGLVKNNSRSHVKQHHIQVDSLLNDVELICCIKSSLLFCLQLKAAASILKKHQLRKSVAIDSSALPTKSLTSKDNLKSCWTTSSVNHMEELFLDSQKSATILYLKYRLIIENILMLLSQRVCLNQIEPEDKEIISITYEINSSAEIVSNLFEKSTLFVHLSNPSIRNIISAKFVLKGSRQFQTSTACSHNISIHVFNGKFMIRISSDEKKFERDSDKAIAVSVILASELSVSDAPEFLETLHLILMPAIVCTPSTDHSSSGSQFSANLSVLRHEETWLSKIQILKTLKAKQDLYCHKSQPCMVTVLLTDHISNLTERINLLQERNIASVIIQKDQETLFSKEKHHIAPWIPVVFFADSNTPPKQNLNVVHLETDNTELISTYCHGINRTIGMENNCSYGGNIIECRKVEDINKTLLPFWGCETDKIMINLRADFEIEKMLQFSFYVHQECDIMRQLLNDHSLVLNEKRDAELAIGKKSFPFVSFYDQACEKCHLLTDHLIDEKLDTLFVKNIANVFLIMTHYHYRDNGNRMNQELIVQNGHLIGDQNIMNSIGRTIIYQNIMDLIYRIQKDCDIETVHNGFLDWVLNTECAKHESDFFQLDYFKKKDLNYISFHGHLKRLAQRRIDYYLNATDDLLIDHLVFHTTCSLRYSDKLLLSLYGANRHILFGQSKNDKSAILVKNLPNEKKFSNGILTKLHVLRENEEDLSKSLLLSLCVLSLLTQCHPFMSLLKNEIVTKLLHEIEEDHCVDKHSSLAFLSSHIEHYSFMSSLKNEMVARLLYEIEEDHYVGLHSSLAFLSLHPERYSSMSCPVFSTITSSHMSHHPFVTIFKPSNLDDSFTNKVLSINATKNLFTKSVQTDNGIVIKTDTERSKVNSVSVMTNSRGKKTSNCSLTSGTTLTYNLCGQLHSFGGEIQFIIDRIIGKQDFIGSRIVHGYTENNDRDFISIGFVKDSHNKNELDSNCSEFEQHLNHTCDRRTDSTYSETIYPSTKNNTCNSETDFICTGISQNTVHIYNNETNVKGSAIINGSKSSGGAEKDIDDRIRSENSVSTRSACRKGKKNLKKLLWKFYKKNEQNKSFVGKQKPVIRKHQKHPPTIELLLKSFFKELENDPSLKTFDKFRKDLIFKIFNQKFGNNCYLYPVDQKPLAVESTQDLENARAENETAAPEDIERSEESSNEGLDAYFQEMQQETPPSLEETMRFELMRLKSFWSFPRNIDVSPIMLAKWGFYYTGNSAETRCFCCAASYRNWEDNDNPQQVHQRISPYCPFITGTDVRNVSIYRSDDRPSTTQVSSESSSSRLVTPSAETQSREQGSRQNTNRSTGQRGDFDLSDFSYRAPETVATTPPAAASTSTGVPQAVSAVSNQQTTSVSTTTSTLTGATASSSTAPPASSTSTANSNTASVTSSITAKPSDAVSIATTSTTSASASAASNINSGHSGNTVATTTGDLTSVPGQARSSSTSRANTASSQSGASPATQQRYDPLGINFDRPRYPSYAVLSNRTASFAAWPQYLRAGREMALAGFFYAGYGDYVRCFFCGGGLRNWDAQDDPWHEHAKWFPRCAFVRMNKGEKYVNTIQNELEEMERERAQGNTTVHQVDETTQGATAGPSHNEVESSAVRAVREMGAVEDVIQKALEIFHNRQASGENLEELDATVLMHIILDEIESSPTTEQPPSASGRGPLLAESRSKIKEFGSSDSAISSNEDEASASGGIGAKSNSKSSRKRKSKRKKRKNRKDKPAEDTECVKVTEEVDEELESLQKENLHLREQLLCKICCEKSVSVAFLPCGHLVCCDDCAPAMRKCPICNDYIRGTVKTFFP